MTVYTPGGGGGGAVAPLTLTAPNATTVPLTLVGAPGQTADGFEVLTSSGHIAFAVGPNPLGSGEPGITLNNNVDAGYGNCLIGMAGGGVMDIGGNATQVRTGPNAAFAAGSGTGTVTLGNLGLTTINTKLNLQGFTTGTTAPGAGGAGALPATPAGYVTIQVGGTNRQIPYY